MTQSGTLAELNWTSVQLDFVSRGPNNLPSVAPVHQRSDDAYDRSLDFFHSVTCFRNSNVKRSKRMSLLENIAFGDTQYCE